MSPDVWLPGSAEPSLDDFVARVVRRISSYTETHTADRTHVTVELADGEQLALQSLSGEPGYGFVTLSVHPADGEPEEIIVPVGSIRRISLGPADEARRPGFALLEEEGPGTAA